MLLWQILGACIRPGVSWDKVALLYSTVGSNGKGTFCELARGLCGSGHASLAIADFEKDFALEKLVSATAVIADENNVGAHIDKSANFKAAATGDMLHVNRKYKIPITYRFRGFIIQCVNELPKVKDKSESFNRRLLCVPFEKSFRGAERKYIKHDYLHRKDILEYVLYKILHMDYDELSEPEACKNLLHEYRTNNNPVLDFAEEMLPELKWDFVPFTFLYDLFKAWFRQTNPSGIVVGYKTFLFGLLNALAAENLGWYCQDKNQAVRPGNRMDAPEPLILEYDLEDWKNPMYKGGNPDMICRPILKPNYRGILRGPSPSAFHAACADIPENPFT